VCKLFEQSPRDVASLHRLGRLGALTPFLQQLYRLGRKVPVASYSPCGQALSPKHTAKVGVVAPQNARSFGQPHPALTLGFLTLGFLGCALGYKLLERFWRDVDTAEDSVRLQLALVDKFANGMAFEFQNSSSLMDGNKFRAFPEDTIDRLRIDAVSVANTAGFQHSRLYCGNDGIAMYPK